MLLHLILELMVAGSSGVLRLAFSRVLARRVSLTLHLRPKLFLRRVLGFVRKDVAPP